MSVVQPEADLLVLTETGYGKRVRDVAVPAQAPGRSGRPPDQSRGPQDGRRRGGAAGDRERRGVDAHPAGGQVVRTEIRTDQPPAAPTRAASSRCASTRATAWSASRRSARGWRTALAWTTMTPPATARRRAPVAIPARDGSTPAGGGRVRRPVRRLHRQRQSGTGPEDLPLPERRARSLRGLPVREREHLRQDPRQRSREGRVHRPADLAPGEPVDHGAPDHDRRLQAGERGTDHRRRAVLRVRPLGQEGPAASPDHGAPHRRHDHRGGRRPAADDGPAPGPDPGLLQHPGRRADRRPPALELLPPEGALRARRRDRPRVREARADVRRAARRPARDHREATRRQPRPGRADERHRRGPRASRDHRGRRDRHGEHAAGDRAGARARGRHRDLRLRHARHPVRPGRSTGSATRAFARS